MTDPQTALQQALGRLRSEGGSDNRLVVTRGPAWFVLRASRGATEARCIAATQRLLGDQHRIPADGVVALRMADFAKPRGARTLSRSVDISTEEARADLAGVLLSWLEAVFGLDSSHATAVSLSLGDVPVFDNERLHQAIRVLASDRSPDARQSVYRALLRAQLLLVVDEHGAPAPFGTLGGAHTYAVFTSVAEADLRDPRGLEMKLVHGWSIFPELSALTPGSLQINPGGRLGGELYRNELESLARASGSYRR
ncbi:MAG: SseB family protein [Deltaproteobacteria bacterium]|nr:SseB family protein [Deltaproteobacteria bacterium]